MKNEAILVAVGLLLASTASSTITAKADLAHAQQILIEAGYAKIDLSNGEILLNKPVLEILKENGFANESLHTLAGPGFNTRGGGCDGV